MRKTSGFNEFYRDLLTDPELRPLVEELDSLYPTPRLPDRVTWNSIRTAYTQETSQKSAGRPPKSSIALQWWQQFGRKAMLIPVVITLFPTITAFTLAFSPLLQSLLNQDTSSNIPLSYAIYDDINQAQKIGNTTVTLEKGYADANQIILGLTLSPPNPHIMFQNGALQTQNGDNIASSSIVQYKSNESTNATRAKIVNTYARYTDMKPKNNR